MKRIPRSYSKDFCMSDSKVVRRRNIQMAIVALVEEHSTYELAKLPVAIREKLEYKDLDLELTSILINLINIKVIEYVPNKWPKEIQLKYKNL